MPPPKDVYAEIVEELSKLKNMYPYSNNNDSYNKIVQMCIGTVNAVKSRKENSPNPIQPDVKNN